MSTPIYHEQIVALRRYSHEVNWFQSWFFPAEVMNYLEIYSSETANVSQAFDVYSALAQGNPFLNWIRQLFLPGLKHFVEEDFTQAVLNQETLTLDTFTQQATLAEEVEAKIEIAAAAQLPAPTADMRIQESPAINLPTDAPRNSSTEHQPTPSAAATPVLQSPVRTMSANDHPDPHNSPVHHEQVLAVVVAAASIPPITVNRSLNSPQSLQMEQLARDIEDELSPGTERAMSQVQGQPAPAFHSSPLAAPIIVMPKEPIQNCCGC